ncbi:MAG: ATP-binding protein [bacterium]
MSTLEGRLDIRIFAGLLFVILVSLGAIGFQYSRQEDYYLKKLAEDTRVIAERAALDVKKAWERRDLPRVSIICGSWQGPVRGKVRIVDTRGRWWGSPVSDYSRLAKPLDLEVKQAFADRSGVSWRLDPVISRKTLYVAVKLSDQPKAVLRVARPLSEFTYSRSELYFFLWAAGGTGLLLAWAISVIITRRVRLPAGQITARLGQLADGDLYAPVSVEDSLELDGVFKALKSALKALRKTFKMINYEKGNLDAILSGMSEGVIAVGRNEQVWRINQAAADMLEVSNRSQKKYWRMVRNSEICELIQSLLDRPRECDEEVVIYSPSERFLSLKAAPIQGRKRVTGVVMVLNDITRLKRLDLVRREFVANVSHELKTPLTSIKGALETLSEGAISDETAAENFLKMALRHADRLTNVVDDLLTLSRLESPSFYLELSPLSLAEEIQACFDQMAVRAAERSIDLKFSPAEEPVMVKANRSLLQTVFINLLDNAVKYSAPGRPVFCSLEQREKTAVITIKDQGMGIPPLSLSRVFERFYRVDSSRSRELGGTGLGLSIVKHVLAAHQGEISLESELGKGSSFLIRLPVYKRESLQAAEEERPFQK